MIRPMASNISTLSSFVAKSHQAIHFVSSAPSKIPYGGFSPVRLQTRFMQRPSSQACPRQLIGRHCWYLRSGRLIRSGTCVQPAPRTSDRSHESSGPWLPSRLYCPAGSSLTMATSAPLTATQRIMDYSARLRDRLASLRGSPIYSACPYSPCRRPYSGGPSVCIRRCLQRRYCLRHIRSGSTTTCPTNPNRVGRVTKLQHSLNATAWRVCTPCFGQGFYDRACMGGVAPLPTSVITRWSHRHLPSPDFHRLDWQPYGLHTDEHGLRAGFLIMGLQSRGEPSIVSLSVSICVHYCPGISS